MKKLQGRSCDMAETVLKQLPRGTQENHGIAIRVAGAQF
jgi:hypothetical protein